MELKDYMLVMVLKEDANNEGLIFKGGIVKFRENGRLFKVYDFIPGPYGDTDVWLDAVDPIGVIKEDSFLVSATGGYAYRNFEAVERGLTFEERGKGDTNNG